MSKANVFGLGVAAVAIIAWNAAFSVPEGFQAIVTQFGQPQGEPRTTPGLHFKVPFVQDVRYLDRRILNWDGEANQVPTKDQKVIVVDTTARWRISEPRTFIEKLVDERSATSRVGSIITSATRDTISSADLVEAVRSTNTIIEKQKIANAEASAIAQAERGAILSAVAEEITTDLDRIKLGREQLSGKIAERAGPELRNLGIELIDVQLQRVAYERSVEQSMFQTMISEQNRIAEKFRSIGKGEQARIQGKRERDLKEIQSEAYRKVQEIRGKAEAEAIGIYAKAIGSNAKFYEFLRTMEVYQRGLQPGTNLILSGDAEFLRTLSRGAPGSGNP
jgi:membrane protease subunit HflC